jgi:hypothetical protein
MAIEIIRWQGFFEKLQKQPKSRLDEWLAHWCFGEEGAFRSGIAATLSSSAPIQNAEDDLRARVENAAVWLFVHQSSTRQTFH